MIKNVLVLACAYCILGCALDVNLTQLEASAPGLTTPIGGASFTGTLSKTLPLRSDVILDPEEIVTTSIVGPDGHIYNAGTYMNGLAVWSYNQFGNIRTEFGNQGVVLLKNSPLYANNYRLVLRFDEEERLLVALSYDVSSEFFVRLYRMSLNGDYDSEFGEQGSTSLTFPSPEYTYVNDMLIDSANRIYLAFYQNKDNQGYQAVVSRHTVSGELDSSFGNAGWSVLPTPVVAGENFRDGGAYSLAFGPSGSIFVGGSIYGEISKRDGILWKLSEEGELDLSFNSIGSIRLQTSGNQFEGISKILISNNKIFASGLLNGHMSDSSDIVVWKLDLSGLLDNSFNGSGYKVFSNLAGGNKSDIGGIFDIDSSEAIILAGRSYNGSGNSRFVQRVLADGSPDLSFNGTGIALINFNDNLASGQSLLNLPDSNLMLVTNFGATSLTNGGTHQNAALWKLTSNGEPVAGFGNGGLKVFDETKNFNLMDQDKKIFTDPSGVSLIVSFFDAGRLGYFSVLKKIDGQGNIDEGFGTNGQVSFSNFLIESIILREEAIFTIVKYADNDSNNKRKICRINSDGVLDENWANGGCVENIYNEEDFDVTSMHFVPQTDGALAVFAVGYDLVDYLESVLMWSIDSHGILNSNFGGTLSYKSFPVAVSEEPFFTVDKNFSIFMKIPYYNDATQSNEARVIKILPTGDIDTNFGVSGSIDTENLFGGLTNSIEQLITLSDGRLLMTFTVYDENTELPSSFISIFDSSGNLLTSLGNAGIISLHQIFGQSQDNWLLDAIELTSGKIRVFAINIDSTNMDFDFMFLDLDLIELKTDKEIKYDLSDISGIDFYSDNFSFVNSSTFVMSEKLVEGDGTESWILNIIN